MNVYVKSIVTSRPVWESNRRGAVGSTLTLTFFFLPAPRVDRPFFFLTGGVAGGAAETSDHSSGSFRRPWKWSSPSDRGRCRFVNVTAKLSRSTKSNQSKLVTARSLDAGQPDAPTSYKWRWCWAPRPPPGLYMRAIWRTFAAV